MSHDWKNLHVYFWTDCRNQQIAAIKNFHSCFFPNKSRDTPPQSSAISLSYLTEKRYSFVQLSSENKERVSLYSWLQRIKWTKPILQYDFRKLWHSSLAKSKRKNCDNWYIFIIHECKLTFFQISMNWSSPPIKTTQLNISVCLQQITNLI